ncbi:MAG: UbiD family decarboxylase [Betaproteobacteria bacterium]|nr:UbiD family decarboxylase [Betaproteobacteria bacterium]
MPYPWKSLREWVADEEKGGEVVKIKAPIKCGDYSNIVDIGNGVPGKQPQTEIRAVVGYLHTLPGKPIGIIEHPVNNRPDIPVLLNPWPSRERTLRGIGLKSKDELCLKLQEFKRGKIPPVAISKKEAPCKEVIIPGDKIDLRKEPPSSYMTPNPGLMTWAS